MRLERWRSIGWACFLGLTAVLGGIGCMITAFQLTVSMTVLLLSWTLAAVVFALCRSFRVSLYPLLGLALLGGYLWQSGPLSQSMEKLLWQISQIYDGGYGCGTIRWSQSDLGDVYTTTALCWLGLIIVFAVVRSVIDRRGVWLAVFVSFLPLVSCLVVTDTVPAVLPLFALLLALALLVMTHGTRRREESQGNRLTALLLLPMALALALLFLLIPKNGYDGQAGAERLEQLLMGLFQEEPKLPQFDVDLSLDLGLSGTRSQKVYLETVGPKSKSTARVMWVTPAKSGTLYLRGASYVSYTGVTWVSDSSLAETGWPEALSLTEVGDVSVSTISTHDVLYVPYYTTDAVYDRISGGVIANKDGLKEYSFSQLELTAGVGEEDFEKTVAPYLQLPEDTYAWASQLTGQLLADTQALSQEAVGIIASYVRSSASYDLETPRMDAGYEDFVQWFLTESDTGYCVHFASATAVLLRAAGIPARYVTGYMVSGEAGEQTLVLGQNAHAWVEYRLPGQPWKVLESTPADTGESPAFTLPQQTTSVTEETTQPQTPAQSEQTLPSQTLPVETSAPTEQEAPKDSSGEAASYGWLVWLAVAVIAVVLQWRLRVTLRRRRRGGRKNARALGWWRDIERMSHLLGQQPSEELLELAQKAKFSQHVLTNEELSRFSHACSVLQTRLKQQPLPKRLYYTLILALY